MREHDGVSLPIGHGGEGVGDMLRIVGESMTHLVHRHIVEQSLTIVVLDGSFPDMNGRRVASSSIGGSQYNVIIIPVGSGKEVASRAGGIDFRYPIVNQDADGVIPVAGIPTSSYLVGDGQTGNLLLPSSPSIHHQGLLNLGQAGIHHHIVAHAMHRSRACHASKCQCGNQMLDLHDLCLITLRDSR